MSAPVLVPGYRHLPGHHCGSTALRNLLAFHGWEMSEAMAFGLGAGACYFYVTLPDASPSRFMNGRTGRLEHQFVELTGAPLRLRTSEDTSEAWRMAREAVDEGRPALLLTDLYYLDHYGSSAHFPGHAVVLAGYDDEVAYLSDTAFEELQTTALKNLSKARNAKHPVMPVSGDMFDLPPGAEPGDLSEAIPRAIARAAEAMLDPPADRAPFQGMGALERLAAEVESWPSEALDWQWCARFSYQVIERRGTGGGNFRHLYAGFLAEAGLPEAAALATEAAEGWTALAEDFRNASEADEADPAQWKRLREQTESVTEAERSLWETLAAPNERT